MIDLSNLTRSHSTLHYLWSLLPVPSTSEKHQTPIYASSFDFRISRYSLVKECVIRGWIWLAHRVQKSKHSIDPGSLVSSYRLPWTYSPCTVWSSGQDMQLCVPSTCELLHTLVPGSMPLISNTARHLTPAKGLTRLFNASTSALRHSWWTGFPVR